MTRLLLKPFQRALAACLVAAVSFCLPQEAEAGFLIILASSEKSAEQAVFAWGREWKVPPDLVAANLDAANLPMQMHRLVDGRPFQLYQFSYHMDDDVLITAGAPPEPCPAITLFADPAAVARYLDSTAVIFAWSRGIDPVLSPRSAAPGLPETQYMQALLEAAPGVLDRRMNGLFVSQIPSGNGTYPVARALTAIVVEYLADDLFVSTLFSEHWDYGRWDCPEVAKIYRALEQGFLPAPARSPAAHPPLPGSPAVRLAIAAANATDPPLVRWHPAPRQAQPTQAQAAPARNQRDHYAAHGRRDDGKYGVQIAGGPVIPLALLPLQPPRAHRPPERGSGCSIQ